MRKSKILLVVLLVATMTVNLFIPWTTQAITIKVRYGDVDLNDTLSATDALLALQMSVGKFEPDELQFEVARVSRGEKIIATDALLILQAATGKLSPADFPSGEFYEYEEPILDEYTLTTANATLLLAVTGNDIKVTSLNANGIEYIQTPQTLTLPELKEEMSLYRAKPYKDDRGTTGYDFVYTGGDLVYELFVASNTSFSGPFEFWGELTNNASTAKAVEDGYYFDLGVKFNSTPTATTFNKESGLAEGWTIYSGAYLPGTGIYNTGLGETSPGSGTYGKATANFNASQDWNSGGDISMMYINTGDNGLYFAEEWSHGKLVAQGDQGNTVGLHAQIGPNNFKTSLPAGESMTFPPVYVGVYKGDMDDGSNLYKRWFLNVKAPENMIKNTDEPLTQQDMQLGYNVSQYGIQSIKWDYGWWSATGNAQEGLLEVNNPNYLAVLNGRTLKEFSDEAKANGVTLALYYLTKDTGLDREGVPTSVGKYGHPEWFANRTVRNGLSADLGNISAVAFYQKYMADFFNKNGITTWRSDFEPICRASDKENRHAAKGTDVQYWCTVGFEELVDYLADNVKNFRYESCSSGGSMKDLFTMTKASVINCDDSADYMSLHMSFYDSSYCIHPAQLQLPINSLTYTKGSSYYTGCADYMYGLRTQLTGGVMLTNWNGTNSMVKETDYWPEVVGNQYNNMIKPLIRNGDLYHILPRPDGKNWDGLEYVDLTATGPKGVVMLWKPNGAANQKTVTLRGLDENTDYSLTFIDHPEQNCVKSGAELMSDGLTVDFTESVASDFIFLDVAQ